MFGWLKNLRKKRTVESSRYKDLFYRKLKAQYDSARTTDENERHWLSADLRSASASASKSVREKIRSRARYELQENNSYGKGIILTLANDLIGTGPRLQILSPDEGFNLEVELAFRNWAKASRLGSKLRTMRLAKATDGEAFALLTTNPKLATDIKLDVRLYECDQFTDPLWVANDPDNHDGLKLDDFGNPESYEMLRQHPGDMLQFNTMKSEPVPASNVLHWFRCDRPGQHRGVSEVASSLPLFAMGRRFTLATLAAAETAANFAGVMYTDAPPSTEAETLGEDEWFSAIPLEYRSMLTLPHGWKMGQVDPAHPATTYDMFKREIIAEIARCFNMPYNLAAGDSSRSNYASGRLDHQSYFKSIKVDRSELEFHLDRVLIAFLEELLLQPEEVFAPRFGGRILDIPFRWFWDSHKHVDPDKESKAVVRQVSSGLVAIGDATEEHHGTDFDTVVKKTAKAFRKDPAEVREAIFTKLFAGNAEDEPAEVEELEEVAG